MWCVSQNQTAEVVCVNFFPYQKQRTIHVPNYGFILLSASYCMTHEIAVHILWNFDSQSPQQLL